jgi:tetratricopeptide (TPR) repeat protein/O-antigen ligase
MFKQLEKIREYIILGIVFLFPVTFAGSFIDQIQLPKLILLGLLISFVFILTAIQIYMTGKVEFARSKFDLPVLLIVFSYLISGVIMTPNKYEAFFNPGNATFIVLFGIVYFLVNTINDKTKVKAALVSSATVLSFMIFGSFLGIFEKINQLPLFLKAPLFNPAGDYLTSTIFLVSTIPFGIWFMVKETDIAKKLIFSLCLVFILVAAGISVFTLASPDKKALPTLPPYQVSWAIATDAIKESPALGIGPGNYLTAFNLFRPVSYNKTSLWQLRFSTGRNWYLTLLTETGIVGAIALVYLLLTLFKLIDKYISIYKQSLLLRSKESLNLDVMSVAILIGLLISIAIIPATAVTLLLLFILLSLNSQPKAKTIIFDKENSNTPRFIVGFVIVAAVVFIAFKTQPLIAAEAKFKSANDALQANDGKKTYDNLQQAINLNPFVDRYHASYAQVNLAIARSIAATVKDPKDLTDAQKNTILQLIQQAIREGQNTVTLNPTRAANWQVLANIYQVVIPYANSADQFAIQSYNQTITLDPIDPNLRISLGNVYFSLGQYDNAISSYQLAAAAKPDMANAYYNLANAYAAKSDFTNAVAAMNGVISLVPKDSYDYKLAQSNLITLQKKQKDLEEATGSANLTTPQKQTQALNPQLNLPEEASPPAAPKLPNASPTPSSGPTKTP